MVSLIKSLLDVKMDQQIFLKILKMIIVMTNDYLKYCNGSFFNI